MILNAYAIADGFIAALRLPLALLVIGLAFHTWRYPPSPDDARRRENAYYLLLLIATLLLGLNLGGWPVFYALLQSYVPQWPGVMCIYGVTQIGRGSEGLSRFLPTLITILQVTKPLAIFASGAWFVLYLLNRRLPRSELMPRTLVLMILFGIIAALDATLEGAYLLIPKSEQFLDVGCCTAALDDVEKARRFIPNEWLNVSERRWVTLAYFGLNAGLPLSLLACRFQIRRGWLALPLLAALASSLVNWVYLVEIAAPAILRLPYHHCPYDVLAEAPESAIGIALFLWGVFAIGWAWLVDRMGRIVTIAEVDGTIQRLLFVAAFAYLSSLAMFTVETVLA